MNKGTPLRWGSSGILCPHDLNGGHTLENGITEFLRDTSIYSAAFYAIDQRDPLQLISQALAEISTHILDLEDKKPVQVFIDDESYVLILGKLGSYLIPATSENLNQVSLRLYQASHSTRFIRAILGHWPA